MRPLKTLMNLSTPPGISDYTLKLMGDSAYQHKEGVPIELLHLVD
jgi:hypothetical protein